MTAIEIVCDFDRPLEWDTYVESHPEGRFSQLFAYRCLQRVYGYRPRYAAFLAAGRIVGVLPAFEARSALFGRRLVSQPFSEYGGFLLNGDLSEAQREAIVDGALTLARSAGVDALEAHGNLGFGQPSERFSAGNFYQTGYLPLEHPTEHMWNKVISRHIRKAIRKSEREGLRAAERTDAETLTRYFYPLYVRSMSRLGVPPHSVDYFLEGLKAFGTRMRIFWAFYRDEPIAALLGFSCGRRVSIVNIASDERYWHLRPNDLIHWEYIKWAGERGFRYFDFGSIRYEGQAQFKRKWGCETTDSGYFFLSARSVRSRPVTFDSSSRKMALAARLWARWVPASVARIVGPVLRKHLIR